MFDRFTDRARKVMGLSRQEAQRFNHDYIGTEHILLGLILEGGGVASDVLKNLSVDPAPLRQEVERNITHGTTMVTTGQLPFTPRAKKVLELALEEASNLGHNYIGTEHLLLGLIREERGIAAQALHKLGVRLREAREQILHVLGRSGDAAAEDREPRAQERQAGARPTGFFDRFTDRARKAMGLSRQEALRLQHDHIGTEHILLAILKEGKGVAADALKNLDVDPKRVKEEVEKRLTPGPAPVAPGQLPFTPEAKTVLKLSLAEATGLGHHYIGTEHLLLGLVREEESIAAQALLKLNVRLKDAREEVVALIGQEAGRVDASGPESRAPGVPEALTGRAEKAMRLAREQAERWRHDRIGTEHILLGLVDEETALGGELANLLLRRVRAEVEKLMTAGKDPAKGRLPLAPDSIAVMELALKEAQALGHERIGTGHLIVGLIRENGPAARALSAVGIRLEDALEDARKRGGTFAAGGLADTVEDILPPRPIESFAARKAMSLARQAAQRFEHDYIGTEHVLLGLLAAGATAVALLGKLGIDPERVRAETEKRITPGKTPAPAGQLPFTPAMKRVLELSLDEARGHNSIRDEHLLLGLLREGKGTAAQALAALGVTPDAVRKALGPPAPPG